MLGMLRDRNLVRAVLCVGGAVMLYQEASEYIYRWIRRAPYEPNPYQDTVCRREHARPRLTFARFIARHIPTGDETVYHFIGGAWREVAPDGTHAGGLSQDAIEALYADPNIWHVETP